jgi:hypothetical protein
MKAYGGLEAYIHVFLTPVLVGELPASGSSRFTHGETCSYIYVFYY